MSACYAEMLDRIDRVLARRRRSDAAASRDEIDGLYTDACAMVLSLEGERLELERGLAALEADAADAAVIRRSRDLARRRAELDTELDALRALTAGLSTAADWVRDPLALDVASLLRWLS